ncbi:MAG: ABC transporter permease [Acidimicrobiia bacterium]|nr:ABC transporter permease [Acidimicrobiia bacterium]NNF89136.1 ABC transporter permease [Acidimicrobiia bacterium]NNL14943.1 ABC transporter permease [Acidimicrobiia bacterium]NNL97624.1 ABC transporter permease [Acidimicrobiia bacterium]RZV44583.1 MAG: ABC transporter permease [Acidimicrobiia bacterium]
MKWWTTVGLVAVRELVERARSKAFIFSTAFILLLVVAAVVIPAIVEDDGPGTLVVVSSGDLSDAVVERFEASSGGDPLLELSVAIDDATVRAAVEAGDADVGVVAGPELVIASGEPGGSVTLLAGVLGFDQAISQLGEQGISVADLAPLLQADVPVTALKEGIDPEDATLAFVGVILLYVTILTYGQWVVLGVIEEKSNRVVEVVLGAVQPRHLLAGKVIGIGLLGVGQVVAIGLIAFGASAIGGDAVSIPDAAPTAFFAALLWYIVGFGIYGVMFAAAGALASRQEEAGNAALPFTILLTIGYIVSFSGVEEPNLVVRILSFLPPFAPVSMQLRMVNGDAALWEVLLSLAIAMAMIYAVIRVGERFYRGAVLGQGGKLKWREAWRSAEQ